MRARHERRTSATRRHTVAARDSRGAQLGWLTGATGQSGAARAAHGHGRDDVEAQLGR